MNDLYAVCHINLHRGSFVGNLQTVTVTEREDANLSETECNARRRENTVQYKKCRMLTKLYKIN